MNRNDRRIAARLRSAFEVEMGADSRDRQLAEVSTALRNPTATGRYRVHIPAIWRRSISALMVAATFSTPAAVAVAAEGTLPGDTLYPVKHVTEALRSVVDPTVSARNRIDEADRMHEMGFSIDELEVVLVDADHAITDAGDPHDLRSRLIEVRNVVSADVAAGDVNAVESAVAAADGDSGNDAEGSWMAGEQPELSESREVTADDNAQEMDTVDDTATTSTGDAEADREQSFEEGASCSDSTATPQDETSETATLVDPGTAPDTDIDSDPASYTWDEQEQD